MKTVIYGIGCIFCVSFVLVSCAQKGPTKTAVPAAPQILRFGSATDMPVLQCWFVEDDGSGKSGYAAADGRRGWLPPDGGGLFSSIKNLRNAMRQQNVHAAIIVPSYDDEVPKGWKIRSLTATEVGALQNR